MNKHIVDQSAREYALTPDRSFIVQAPAGSGKTELLTQRYLMLLAQAENSPEEIIAITFTRKAASEMRERVLNAFQMASDIKEEIKIEPHKQNTWKLAKKVLEKDRQLHWNLMDNPSRCQILTIDSLCTRICAQIPLLSAFGASPRIIESPQEYYFEATKETILMIESDAPWSKSIEKLLQHLDNQVYFLQDLFANILAKRDQWLPHVMNNWKNSSELKKLLEQSLRQVQFEAMQSVKKNISASSLKTLIHLAHNAGCYLQKNNPQHPINICHELKSIPNLNENDFQYWYGLASLLLTKTGQWRSAIDKRCGFPPKSEYKPHMEALLEELSQNDQLLFALNAILNCPPIHYEESQWIIIQSLLEILPILTAQLNIIFQAHGVIDFVELNLAALRALGDNDQPTDLALYMDHQIRHILVDEFQDTSVIQFNLLERLVAGWQVDDGRTIFLVGDPMQSIYRFRNAEVGLFLRAKEKGIGDISLEFVQLQVNFRSDAPLVDWVNNAFSKIFPKTSDITLGAIPLSPAIAANPPSEKNGVNCHPIHDNENEAQKMVEIIHQCMKKNPKHSMAILVRSRNHLIDIIPFLRENQIPFQAIELESLYFRPEIQDLISLTRALMHLGDQTAWLSILRAPWCGLLLTDLYLIAQTAKRNIIWDVIKPFEKIENLSDDAKLRLKRIIPILSLGFSNQSRIHFSYWIKSIWMALGGPATLTSNDQIKNVEQFFQLLDTLGENLEEFSIEVLELKTQELFAISDPSNSALQVMTIHRAKGLEFDHVLIPGLSHRTSNEKNTLLKWQERPSLSGDNDLILAPIKASYENSDAIYDYLRYIEKQKLNYEAARLLYVAVTRAKKTIHFFCELIAHSKYPDQLKTPDKGSFMEMLWPIYQEKMQEKFLKKSTTEIFSTPEKNSSSNLFRLSSDWQLPPLNSNHLQNSKLNLMNPQNTINLSEMKIEYHLPRIIGTVIHEALQQLAEAYSKKLNIDINKKMKQWSNRLLILGTPKSLLKISLNQVSTAIHQTLQDEKGRWILENHRDAHNELALSGIIKDEIIHVILDRSFIDKTNTRWIIDYKTAQPENISLQKFLSQQKDLYEEQLNQYAMIWRQKEDLPIKLGLYFPTVPAWCEWDARL